MADNPRVAIPIPTREQVHKDITDARSNLRASGWLPPEAGSVGPAARARQAKQEGRGVDLTGARNYKLSGDTRATDYARGLGKGFVDIVGALAGAVEMTGIVPAGSITKGIDQYSSEIVQNMSPSARKNLEREWTNLSSEGALRNPKAVLQQLTTVLPSLAVSMGGAGLAARAGVKGAQTAAAEAGKTLTKKELQKVAATRGAVAGAAIEGPQITGATLNELRGAMEGMTHGELIQYSPEYAKAYKRHGGEAEARQEVLMNASRGPGLVNGILGSMIATVPGAVWGRVLTKTNAPTSLKKHLATTFGAEAAEEVSQEAIAGVTTGRAQQEHIDARHDPYSGMAERLAASFALGGLAGGVGGVISAPGRNAELPSMDVGSDPAAEAAAAAALDVTPAAEMEPGQMALPLEGGEGGAPNLPPGQIDMFGGEGMQPQVSPDQMELDIGAAPLGPAQGELFAPQEMTEQGQLDLQPPPQMEMDLTPAEAKEAVRQEFQQALQFGLGRGTGLTGIDVEKMTVPEPIEDIEAQVNEIFAENSPKDTVYVSPIDWNAGSVFEWDDPMWAARNKRVQAAVVGRLRAIFPDLDWETQQELVNEQFGTNFNRIILPTGNLRFYEDRKGGLVLTTNPAKAKEYENSAQDDAARAELLDYPMAKEDLADPEATVTMEVVNADGTVAETFVLENQPDIYNAVTEAYTARTGMRGGLREDQTVRVRPTGVALTERAERAAEEFGNFIATDMQIGLPFAEGDNRFSTAPEPEPETKRERKAARKIAAKDEADRRSAVSTAAAEGVAEGIERGLAKEDFEARQEPEVAEAAPVPAKDSNREKAIAAATTAISDNKQLLSAATQTVSDKTKSVKVRNAAIQERERLTKELSKAKTRLKKLKSKAPDRTTDMFGGRGTLPEGTYQEVEYRTKEGETKTSRMRPSQRGLSEPSLLSEGGEEIRFDQPEQQADKAVSKRKGRQPKQQELKFPRKFVKHKKNRANEQPVKTRGQVEDEAKQEELTAIAKAKLTSKRRAGGTKGYLRRKVKEGREQASAKEVRALEVLTKDEYERPAKDVPKAYGRTLAEAKADLTKAERRELKALIKSQKRGRRIKVAESEDIMDVAEVGSLDTDYEFTKQEEIIPRQHHVEQWEQSVEGIEHDETSEQGEQREQKDVSKRNVDAKKLAKATLDTRPEYVGTGTAGAGDGRETNLDGTAGGQGRTRGPSITPRGNGNLKGVKGFLRDNFPEVLDNMSADQLQGFAYMAQRILNTPDGSSMINGDAAGFGKTRQLLALAAWVENRGGNVLYVTPNKGIWRATVSEGQKTGLYPVKQNKTEIDARTPLTETFQPAAYRTLANYADQEYDLVIFDEAHNLRNEGTVVAKVAAELKAKHKVYATATMADKVEFLALLADSTGYKTPESFVKSLGAKLTRYVNAATGKEETGIEGVTPKVLTNLKDALQKAANKYSYYTRSFNRLSTPTPVEVKTSGGYKINGSTPLQIENQFTASLEEVEAAGGKKVDKAKIMTQSAKLSELHKVNHTVKDIIKRVKAGEQAIVFSHYYNDEKSDSSKGKLSFKLKGKQYNYSLPSSLRLIEEGLKEAAPEIKVGTYYGKSTTTANEQFQRGEVQVILGTYQKMSEGISLDDQVGDTPRTQYHLIPDWSADVMAQARARPDRAKTASVPNIFDLLNDEFYSDRVRSETMAIKDKLREVLIGSETDLAYGPQNIQMKPDGKVFKVRLWGVPKDSSTYKGVYLNLPKPDIDGYITYESEQDYKMNGRWAFENGLANANKMAGLAPGFDPKQEATTLESEKTDSVEGKATAVEAADVDKLGPLIDEMFELQTAHEAARDVVDGIAPGTKGYTQAVRDAAAAWQAFQEANERVQAEANKQAAPAMLAPDTREADAYAQQAWTAADEGHPLTVGEFLKGMPKQDMSNAERRVLRKLVKTVGDVRIRAVSVAEVESLTGQTGAAAAYHQGSNEVLISPAASDFTESYVHEAIHAAAHYALDNSPRFRHQISKLINEAGPALNDWLDTLPPQSKAQMVSALTDVHEFVSYGLSSPLLSQQLDGIVTRDRSLLRRVYEAIVSFLGVGRKSTLLDTLVKHSTANFSGEVSRAPLQHGVAKAHAMLGAATMKGLNPLADTLDKKDVTSIGFRNNVRKLGLPMASLRQITTIYERLLNKLDVMVDGKNPVLAWQDAMHKKEQVVKTWTTIGEEMYNDLTRVLAAHPAPEQVDTLIHESSRLGIWANKSLDHKDNKHIVGNAPLEAAHAELSAIYEGLQAVEQQLNPAGTDTVYERLAKYYAEERKKNFETATTNIFYGLNIKDEQGRGGTVYHESDNGELRPVASERAYKEFSEGIAEGKYNPEQFYVMDENDAIDQRITDALAEGVRQNRTGLLQKGPYMPLKRFGKYGVRAKRLGQDHAVELTDEDIGKAEEAARKMVKRKYKKDTKSAKAERLYEESLRRSKHRRLLNKLNAIKNERMEDEPIMELVDVEYDGDKATGRTHVPYYSMHESRAEGIKARDQLIAEGTWEDVTDNVIDLSSANSSMLRSSNSLLVDHIRAKIKADAGDNAPALTTALEAALLQLMPETSVRHEQQNRRGVEGYFNDHGRALASHVQSGAWYRGQLEHGREISEAMAGMYAAKRRLDQDNPNFTGQQEEATKVSNVIDEVVKRAALDSDPQNLGAGLQFMGDLGFVYMLFSPAYMMVNATQPSMIGMPWLKARQRESGLSAEKAFTNAYKTLMGEMFGRGKEGAKGMFTGVNPQLFDFLERNMDNTGQVELTAHLQSRINKAAETGQIRHAEGVIAMLEDLSKSNVMDFTMATDISSAASGRVNTRQNIMDRFRILPHLTEVLNRSVMAVSAYEMAAEMPNMTHDAAVKFAERAVTETQFDYTMMNKPRWMSEQMWKGAKPVFMFMQHPQHIYAMFVQSVLLGTTPGRRHISRKMKGTFEPGNQEHEADRQEFKENYGTLVGILGTHLLMGGAIGAMFEPVKWALGMALFAFEKIEGEPPEETEVYVQRFMQAFLGDELGEIASHGLPAAVGLHMSDALAINNLALMNSPGRYGLDREGVQDMWFAAGGPILSLGANFAEGIKSVTEGDLLGGTAKMMPRVGRDLLKAADLYVDGLQDSRGNTIIDKGEFTPLELFTEATGVRTRRKARAYENKSAIDSAKFFYAEKARKLKERLVRADGDRAATRRVVADIREFNKDMPRSMQVSASLSPSHTRRQKMLQELGAIVTREQEQMAIERRIWDE